MGNWQRKHFLACILEGLRKTRAKPLNYSKLSTISQQLDENPSAFLERLRGALIEHTPIIPDTQEGDIILRDKFVTHTAQTFTGSYRSWLWVLKSP